MRLSATATVHERDQCESGTKALDCALCVRPPWRLTLCAAVSASIVSCLLVALDLWANRDLFDPEGISYLDIADAYRRGDWDAALVGLWSPLYPWLLALMMSLFNPSGQWEFTAVHALNYVIYLVTLASFTYFMMEFLRSRKKEDVNEALPDWCWLILGYSLFTWSIVRLIPPHQPEPDLLVCALLYLIFAKLFRIRAGTITWGGSICLGTLLGLGYLTKGIMFPMGFVFTGVALFLAGRSAARQCKILVAFALFLALSLPYVVFLSKANGRWMFSDAGRLNYAWEINQVKKWNHWQGEERGQGMPAHPTRKVHNDPPMYEFATPFKVTYPPWYDPSYWYEGIKLSMDPRRQMSVIIHNTRILLSFLANSPGPLNVKFVSWGKLGNVESTIGPLLTLFLFLVFMNRGGLLVFRQIAQHWFLLVPIIAVLGAYALLHFEGRYIAAYVVVFWLVLFGSVAIPYSQESWKIYTATLSAAALITVTASTIGTGQVFFRAARDYARGDTGAPLLQSGYRNWKVVEYLHDKGIRAGDAVGGVGWTFSGYWARMARVHVVAEVPAEGAVAFWLLDEAKRAAVMELFRKVGAKAVVAKSGHVNAHNQFEWDLRGLPGKPAPLPVSPEATVRVGSGPANWQHIPGTDYYVYVF